MLRNTGCRNRFAFRSFQYALTLIGILYLSNLANAQVVTRSVPTVAAPMQFGVPVPTMVAPPASRNTKSGIPYVETSTLKVCGSNVNYTKPGISCVVRPLNANAIGYQLLSIEISLTGGIPLRGDRQFSVWIARSDAMNVESLDSVRVPMLLEAGAVSTRTEVTLPKWSFTQSFMVRVSDEDGIIPGMESFQYDGNQPPSARAAILQLLPSQANDEDCIDVVGNYVKKEWQSGSSQNFYVDRQLPYCWDVTGNFQARPARAAYTDWKHYSSTSVVVCAFDTLQTMNAEKPEASRALREWVGLGGVLVVTDSLALERRLEIEKWLGGDSLRFWDSIQSRSLHQNFSSLPSNPHSVWVFPERAVRIRKPSNPKSSSFALLDDLKLDLSRSLVQLLEGWFSLKFDPAWRISLREEARKFYEEMTSDQWYPTYNQNYQTQAYVNSMGQVEVKQDSLAAFTPALLELPIEWRRFLYTTLTQSNGLSADIRRFQFGMVITLIDDDLTKADMSTLSAISEVSSHRGNIMLGMIGTSDSHFWDWMIPDLGTPPIWMFCGLMSVFAIVVGPVASMLFRRRGRRHLFLVFVPLVAAVSTFCLVSFALLRESGKRVARVRSVTLTDQSTGSTSSNSRQTLFVGSGTRDGLKFKRDSFVVPVAKPTYSQNNYNYNQAKLVEWNEYQQYKGWLRPREQLQYELRQPTSYVPRIADPQVVDGGLKLKIVSPDRFSLLFVRAEDGLLYYGQDLEPSSEAILKMVSTQDAGQEARKLMANLALAPPEGYIVGQRNSLFDMGYSRWYGNEQHFGDGKGQLEVALSEFSSLGLVTFPKTYAGVVDRDSAIDYPVEVTEEVGSLHVVAGRW